MIVPRPPTLVPTPLVTRPISHAASRNAQFVSLSAVHGSSLPFHNNLPLDKVSSPAPLSADAAG